MVDPLVEVLVTVKLHMSPSKSIESQRCEENKPNSNRTRSGKGKGAERVVSKAMGEENDAC